MKISSIDLHYLFILSPLLKSEIMTDGVIAQSLDKKDLYLLKMESSIMLVLSLQKTKHDWWRTCEPHAMLFHVFLGIQTYISF